MFSPHLKTAEIKVPAETNTPKPRGTHDHQHATGQHSARHPRPQIQQLIIRPRRLSAQAQNTSGTRKLRAVLKFTCVVRMSKADILELRLDHLPHTEPFAAIRRPGVKLRSTSSGERTSVNQSPYGAYPSARSNRLPHEIDWKLRESTHGSHTANAYPDTNCMISPQWQPLQS